jgi:4-amino-4-deoxy-L-arabinose transferase-like glycosyltransferase
MGGHRLRLSRATLASIIFVYCVLGFAYAVETPRWQTPDEPAHYNYVVYLAENLSFPVLQMGDYPHEYLEEIKAAGFPPEMSIEPIRYESHQPPLYYVLAAAVYRVASPWGFQAQFLALRLLSVLLGAILLVVTYAVVTELFPGDSFLALAATAFVALLPMHIAMSAAINNDILAELILALVTWLCLKEIKVGLSQRQTAALGLLVALALLTKTTIYVPVVLSVLVALAARARERGWRTLLYRLGTVYGLGLLLSGWWFVRNALTYGGLDLFAWHRHDSIVVGQPTTAQWIADHGLVRTVQDFTALSFRSFWAQFGWMGVLIDSRLYSLLGVVSVAVAVGFVLWVWRVARSPKRLSRFQRWALLLLLLVFLVVAAAHVSYNLKFVQHQGRYLFPALIPIAVAFALGLSEWVFLVVRLLARLPLARRAHASLPAILQSLVFLALCLGFALLDLGCLYLFIVPQLRG